MTESYNTYAGAHPSIQINVLKRLPLDRYQQGLARIRAQIAEGLPLRALDDTSPGNKSTSCTWGLCSIETGAWPDAADHSFPVEFEEHGRQTRLTLGANQRCPLDRRETPEQYGCFWSCRAFKPKKGDVPLTAEAALAFYDQALATFD